MHPDNFLARAVAGRGPRVVRLAACLLLVLLGRDLLFQAAPGSEPSLRPPRLNENPSPSETDHFQFLFDDEWIDDKRGVRRVTGSPSKLSGPVFKGERDWEKSAIHPTMSLFYDPELRKFRMWYKAVCPGRTAEAKTGRAADPSEQQQVEERYFICYAESQDGVNWVRPMLGRFAFNGNSDNNIIEEIAPGDSVFHTVVKDPSDPDSSRRYKAIGFQTSGVSSLKANPAGGSGLYVRYSADGLAWPKPAVLVMSTTDLTDSNGILPQRDPVSGNWIGFFRPRTSPKRRFIGYSESRDFDHWTYPRMLMTPDKQDAEWIEFYGIAAAVFGSWRLACLWVFHNNPAFSPVTNELAFSRDGQRYQRALPGHEFIPLGKVGAFDSRTVYPLSWVERASEFFIYYSGSNQEHGSDRGMKMQREIRTPNGEAPVWGIGMARLPWGQFCGLRADLDGMVETKYLTNYGEGGVQAVAALEPDGIIQAEILDQYGKVIPGWQREGSQTRTGDKGRLFFTWKPTGLEGRFGQTSDQGGKVGHVVKLRFYLHKATLFGFQLGRPGSRPDYVEASSSR